MATPCLIAAFSRRGVISGLISALMCCAIDASEEPERSLSAMIDALTISKYVGARLAASDIGVALMDMVEVDSFPCIAARAFVLVVSARRVGRHARRPDTEDTEREPEARYDGAGR